jgi:hypothetical protein
MPCGDHSDARHVAENTVMREKCHARNPEHTYHYWVERDFTKDVAVVGKCVPDEYVIIARPNLKGHSNGGANRNFRNG